MGGSDDSAKADLEDYMITLVNKDEEVMGRYKEYI